jgi:hypothetical protein
MAKARTYILIRILLTSIRLIVLEILSVDLTVILAYDFFFVVLGFLGLFCLALLGFGSCCYVNQTAHTMYGSDHARHERATWSELYLPGAASSSSTASSSSASSSSSLPLAAAASSPSETYLMRRKEKRVSQ